MSSVSSVSLYLLDTNILVHLVREDAVGSRLIREYDLRHRHPRPLICEVTHGELQSLALQFVWGAHRVNKAHELLDYFQTIPITYAAHHGAYALMDQYCVAHGKALSDNDVWIAATAGVSDATLLTTDRDFDPLHIVFLQREWIDPHLDVAK